MKSIYSITVLQRIIDHWGVGRIENVTYFDSVGRNTWRHLIETNKGEFELYSYLPENEKYSQAKLTEFFKDHYGKNFKKIYHSFDRYHLLKQLTIKNKITTKQISKDLTLLKNKQIKKAFRVHGTILLIEFENKIAISSYASWNIQKFSKGQYNIFVNSLINSKNQLDATLKKLESKRTTIQKTILKDSWFELYFENNFSLHFHQYLNFPAVEISQLNKKNFIKFYDEKNIYYVKPAV